jgi:hypothetical protein
MQVIFSCPTKCNNNLISLKALFAKIAFWKTFWTFLMATFEPLARAVAELNS